MKMYFWRLNFRSRTADGSYRYSRSRMRICHRAGPDAHCMTQHKKRKKKKGLPGLPCQWVEEQGFDVVPTSPPTKGPDAPSDTAFLLKAKAASRPARMPGS